MARGGRLGRQNAHSFVNLELQGNRAVKSSNDAGVTDDVGAGEEAALAVLEPLGEDLVAADLPTPEIGRGTVEVLRRLDADASTVDA